MQNMQVHDWFATGHASSDADALNERIYAELVSKNTAAPFWFATAELVVYGR